MSVVTCFYMYVCCCLCLCVYVCVGLCPVQVMCSVSGGFSGHGEEGFLFVCFSSFLPLVCVCVLFGRGDVLFFVLCVCLVCG